MNANHGVHSNGNGNGNDNNYEQYNNYNPQDVEDLLSKELLELNVKDRNDIQEEIHGVKCLAIDETPQMISMSLRLLTIELDGSNSNSNTNSNAVEEMFAYRLARQFPYVHSIEFRLKFLRCELFHIQRTALRIINYLKLLLEYFGIDALRRPLQLGDLSKDEIRLFRQGRLQFLPFRDRSGRRILSIFSNEETLEADKSTKCRIIAYLGQAATEDVETQKQGIVLVMWLSSASLSVRNNGSSFRTMSSDPYKCTCVRFSAIHVCTPDTPLYRLFRSVIIMKGFGNQTSTRARVRFHTGAPIELRYKLVGFGIPTENIPISWTGTMKLTNFRQWMIVRRLLEDVHESTSSSSPSQHYNHQLIQTPAGEFSIADVVECPALNDILFRQGTALRSHPGNVRFRSYIETELHTNPGLTVRQLLKNIIDEIIKKRRGRVLAWTVTSIVIPTSNTNTAPTTDNNTNNNYNESASASASADVGGGGSSYNKRTPSVQKLECWCTLTDMIQINAKIEYTVRDYIRNNPAVAKPPAFATATTARTAATTSTTTKRQKQTRNRQHVSSHTDIFQSEESQHDDKNNGGVGRCCRE